MWIYYRKYGVVFYLNIKNLCECNNNDSYVDDNNKNNTMSQGRLMYQWTLIVRWGIHLNDPINVIMWWMMPFFLLLYWTES